MPHILIFILFFVTILSSYSMIFLLGNYFTMEIYQMGIQVPSAAPFVIPTKFRKTTGSFFYFVTSLQSVCQHLLKWVWVKKANQLKDFECVDSNSFKCWRTLYNLWALLRLRFNRKNYGEKPARTIFVSFNTEDDSVYMTKHCYKVSYIILLLLCYKLL